VTWNAPAPGLYRLRCQSADGTLTDSVGVEVRVDSSAPSAWVVTPPEQGCFGQTDRLELDYQLLNHAGLPMLSVEEPTVEITPEKGWIGNLTTGYRFLDDGVYQVSVRWPGQVAPGAKLAPTTFPVTVDATAPVISFTSPEAGALVTTGGN